MAFKIEGKEMYPNLLVSSLLSNKARQACAQQTEKPFPHKLCSFMSSFCACPANSASIECIFSIMIWYGPTSETGWV